jgi:translocation and assembly module TamB
VRLQGTNVPLVRQSGVVVRSDLDLRVVRTNASLPVVRGDVLIHDSLVVQDLGMLIPGETRPGRRPPYFRVGPGPLAAWQLDVGVRSDRGMRLLSPVLTGDLSSNVRLTGTLGDPMATGELRLNSGKLIFPFANLEVAYGSVALSPRSPDDPEVLLSASGRVLGYQVEVDVSGTALRPLVMLSSVPPLTTQEILLLLASGQFPRGQREFSATDKLGRLGLFLGRDLLTRLGFTGASAERVIIRSGSSISAEGRPTYELEYRLTDDFSAVGEYDRFGGINGGFKWRLYSR